MTQSIGYPIFARKKTNQRKKPPARKKQPAGSSSTGNGLRWYLAGVASGVFGSFLLYLGTLPPSGAPQSVPAAADTVAGQEPPKPRFDFYTMLPEQSIEDDVVVQQPRRSADTPASGEYYLLQAGSFSAWEDADRRKAQIAMLGISSRIQKVTVDDKTYHRVRIGPVEDLGQLEDYRSRLRQAQIDALIIRMPTQ